MFENMNDCFSLFGPVMNWPLAQGAFTLWQQGGSTGEQGGAGIQDGRMDGWMGH